jgi:hypothetical protein
MANLLKTGSDWLQSQQDAHATSSVVYGRGAGSGADTVTVNAIIGRTEFDASDEYGITIRTESRDYLILAADLILDGETVLPERGDTITETDGDFTLVYEVLPIGNQPHWRYSDPFRKRLRVHTKLLSRTEGS